ncbi:MAG: alpha/beta hydrolase [Acidobacteria bacterium]|nr:alpha/beta hydrolase [Acidobacteriota bacterium]
MRRICAAPVWLVVSLIFGVGRFGPAYGQEAGNTVYHSPDYEAYVPETVSPEAQQVLRLMEGPQGLPLPEPNDVAGWNKIRNYTPPQFLKIGKDPEIAKRTAAFAQRYPATHKKKTLGGVPVVEIVPQGWRENGKVLVYTHGGGYVTGNGDFGLGGWVGGETGLRIVSVDYTLAPAAKWRQMTDQVVAVLVALEKEGYAAKNIAVLGDSAGGGLAAGSILKLRDEGHPMPGAVVLWSPWSDITETGDTYVTLRRADPILDYKVLLKKAADAYADPQDQKSPYVSPVYGDYAKGFPPTLIQGGTKEIFLSDFVRHYRAIDNAGGTAVLDLYEGMPHVFQGVMFATPEAQQAMTKMKKFLAAYLGK